MSRGRCLLLTIPLVLSGILVVASPASAQEFSDTDWKTVSAGGSHTCGIDNSGVLSCWGNDDSGQLGNSDALNSKTEPDEISSGWTAVSAGGSHTCGIRSGKLYCWGSDSDGQLGNGSAGNRAVPGTSISGATWKSVTAGDAHTCAIRGDGILACWGDDSKMQVGNGAAKTSDVQSPTLVSSATWKAISAGGTHTCAIRGDGILACWGNDGAGQVGNGSVKTSNVSAPSLVSAARWSSIGAGGEHTCAVRSDGLLGCWGSDAVGQVGNGGGVGTGPSAPTQIAKSFTDWKTVSAGGAHSCAIRGTSNTLYCWGDNEYGQSVASSEDALFTSPQQYAGSWRAQDTGQRHTCAIEGDAQLTCWGVPEPPPNDCPAPPANIYENEPWDDLWYWKLTTPIDANGDGKPDEVKQSSNPPLRDLDGKTYFDRLSDPTRIKFRADVNGVTTSGSPYPRSELREMTQDGQYNRAAWNSNCGTHTMTIRQAITNLPVGKDEVVAGQIHDLGVDGGTGDVVFIHLNGQNLTVKRAGSEIGVLDASYEDDEIFTVVFTASNGKIDVDYSNESSGTTKSIKDITPVFNNEQWFFKAGCYTQANTENGTGYGEVVIYDLNVTHS